MYRVLHRHHHRTGNDWKIYPMYDLLMVKVIILRKFRILSVMLEFVMHRELYNWF
jgi:glutaminyl-tRNA synthetase